jgi:hypothetical protein
MASNVMKCMVLAMEKKQRLQESNTVLLSEIEMPDGLTSSLTVNGPFLMFDPYSP